MFLVLALALGYGFWVLDGRVEERRSGKALRVAVVQGMIEQEKKWLPEFREETVRIYEELSQKAAVSSPQVIVWPETAMPFYFQQERKYKPRILALARKTGSYILFGAPSYEATPKGIRLYNSAYLVSPKGEVAGVYHKIHLVPFGEYVPLRPLLSFLDKLVVGIGDFSPGEEYTIFPLPSGGCGVVICYEVIFPQFVRRFFASGAKFLVNITNDAWFGRSAGPYQHFAISIFRAVENRAYVVRAANTGISGVIDPYGRVVEQTKLFKRCQFAATIWMDGGQSLYTRWGDVWPQAMLVWCLVMLGAGYKKRREAFA